jgi:Putative ER transporter, 6TM, N-terminal
MVATVTVYFHPARSAGSMAEATMLALIAFAYAAAVSLLSMAVSVFFGHQHLLAAGHVIVLIVFCGGGLGFVAWLKQKLGSPLVNVACSLTSLALITVLTKEGAVQAAQFSYQKVYQVLKMVLMGMAATVAVSFLVKPKSARKELRDDLVKITDLLEEFLTTITRSFLSGSDEDLEDKSYANLSSRYRSTFNCMVKDLREARLEHYILGTEEEYRIEYRLVKCIERLGQSLVGLRSAAATQFDLIATTSTGGATPIRRLDSVASSYFSIDQFTDHHDGLAAITEEPEESLGSASPGTVPNAPSSPGGLDTPSVTQPADIFAMFISQLGPPMKSLAYTLKEVLNDLPFGPAPDYLVAVNSNFRSSLVEAKDMFADARKQSLEFIYRNRVLTRARLPEVAADYEEVAASCGYFSSCLQDFAEDTIAYLDILEELKADLDCQPRKRSWKWLLFWRRPKRHGDVTPVPGMVQATLSLNSTNK